MQGFGDKTSNLPRDIRPLGRVGVLYVTGGGNPLSINDLRTISATGTNTDKITV